jgi:hypothetical protein
MKVRKPVSINNRISAFFNALHEIAKMYIEVRGHHVPDHVKNLPKHRVGMLHSHLCEAFYGESYDTRWIGMVKRAAIKCGLKFVGAGRSRLTVTTVYYSKKIAIKLSTRDRNIRELDAARNMSIGLKQVAIVPEFHWDNDLWGCVLAFPWAPIINKGEWDVYEAKDECWKDTGLPKSYQTKAFARQLRVIARYTRDDHPYNIGVINRKPYLIDYDVS